MYLLSFLLFFFFPAAPGGTPEAPILASGPPWPFFRGWIYRDNRASQYVEAQPKLTWTNAVRMCKHLGGNVTEIQTPEENEFISGLTCKSDVWIGLRRIRRSWVLASSNATLPFAKFNHRVRWRGRSCAVMRSYRNNSGGKWFPRSCSKTSAVLCKIGIFLYWLNRKLQFQLIQAFCHLGVASGF